MLPPDSLPPCPSAWARQAPLKPPARSRRLRWLRLTLLVLLLGPAALLLVYRVAPVPMTPLMLVRMAQGYGLEKQWVPLSRISGHLPRAVIASEDNLFCRHGGIDWDALREQIGRAMDGRSARGASTISMQTVKNLLLWEGRDPFRKLLETWLTPQAELLLGKRRILEIYLNVAEMGPGLYGAEAAARRYFRKPARDLTAREAALLAALLPAPLRWSKGMPSRFLQGRARIIQTRVAQLGPLLDCAP